jgi:GntR family transcriptional regulator/MocR family aminotransferase
LDAVDGTSRSVELLLSVDRAASATLGAQIEDQVRTAIRGGALRPDAQLPSTRDLARQLGISRRVVVEAYAQLAAEGYLRMRQGARPRVAESAVRKPAAPRAGAGARAGGPAVGTRGRPTDAGARPGGADSGRAGAPAAGMGGRPTGAARWAGALGAGAAGRPAPVAGALGGGAAPSPADAADRGPASAAGARSAGATPSPAVRGPAPAAGVLGASAAPWTGAVRAARFDFRPSVPDVSAFPRAAWLKSLRAAMASLTDAGLRYGDPAGEEVLKRTLADYLGRVRGVVADPECVVVTNGFGQSLNLLVGVLAQNGATGIALEAPSNTENRDVVVRAGLTAHMVPVDELGIEVARLPDADAVLVTPAHQHPTGVVMAPERRAQLLQWLRDRDALAIEDDYDAEYRYDRAAIGALQGLDPDRIVYAGSASKTLAPALRLGWLVVPPELVEPIRHGKYLADLGTARIEQHALADFIARGELDRHLRRMRTRYRARRDALVAALASELPEATVKGIAAGLHVTAELPPGHDTAAIRRAAFEQRIELRSLDDYDAPGAPTLMLGYGNLPEPAIVPGVRELAKIVRQHRPARDV